MYTCYACQWKRGVHEQSHGLTVFTLFAMHATGVYFLQHALGLQTECMMVLQASVVEASNCTYLPNYPRLLDCQSVMVSL